MAIKSEERQIGTQPSGRLIREFRTQLPSPDLTGVANFAKTIGDIGEKELVRSAKDEATAYAESLKFGRDAEGNFVKPEAPAEFGPMRREIFNDLINRRYTTDVLLDHDAAVAKIYTESRTVGADPGIPLAKAQADMTGRLAGVDPSLRNTIEPYMRKTLIQYNNGYANEAATRSYRTEIINNEAQITALSDRHIRAIASGNTGEAALLLTEITNRRDKLKDAGVLSRDPEADRIFFGSLEVQGRVKQSVLDAVNNPNLDRGAYPQELNRLQRIIKGEAAADETAFGFKTSDFTRLDRTTADRISNDLSATETKFRQQYAVSTQMQKIQSILDETRVGYKGGMYSATPEIQSLTAQQHIINQNKILKEQGLPEITDITSVEGLTEIYNRFGMIPAKLIDPIFAYLSQKRSEKPEEVQAVERASIVLRNIRSLSATGGIITTSQESNFGTADDRNLLDHYITRRLSGFQPEQALEQSRQVIADNAAAIKSKGVETLAMERFSLYKGSTKTQDEFYKDIKNRTEIDIRKLPEQARLQFSNTLYNSIAVAPDYDVGVQNAINLFKKNWVIDPTNYRNTFPRHKDNAYVPKAEAFPIPSDGKNEGVSQWFQPYLGPLLSKYAAPGKDASGKEIEGTITIPGINRAVPISSLELGKNIFFESTKQSTYDSSVPWHQQSGVNPSFNIVYVDPKTSFLDQTQSAARALIFARPSAAGATNLLVIEPHAEAKAQHDAFSEAARTNNVRLNEFEKNSAILRQQRLRTQAAALAGREQDIPPQIFTKPEISQPPMKSVAYGPDGKPYMPKPDLGRFVGNEGVAQRLDPDSIFANEVSASRSVNLYRAPNVDNIVSPSLRKSIEGSQRRSSFDPAGAPPAEFVDGGPVLLANKQTVQLTSKDRDLLIRTVMAEAGSEPADGKAGVAYVVLNRLASGRFGNDVYSILTKKDQFEPWTKNPEKVMAYSPSTPGWRQAAAIVDTMIAGGVSDPTNGATHFANRDIVEARKNTRALRWIDTMSNPTKIGRHTFGSAGGEGAS